MKLVEIFDCLVYVGFALGVTGAIGVGLIICGIVWYLRNR